MGDVEIKTTTHYRDRVATRGSAAYGSGRIDNKNEKKREIKRLSYRYYLFHRAKYEEIPKIKQTKIDRELTKYIDFFRKNRGNFEDYVISRSENKIAEWKKEILKITPRYLTATYDDQEDSIRIEYLGALQNVKKYYSETSVNAIRDQVNKKIDGIKSKGLMPDEPYVITITRSQYMDFVKHELVPLQRKIVASLEEKDTLDKENVQVEGIPK